MNFELLYWASHHLHHQLVFSRFSVRRSVILVCCILFVSDDAALMIKSWHSMLASLTSANWSTVGGIKDSIPADICKCTVLAAVVVYVQTNVLFLSLPHSRDCREERREGDCERQIKKKRKERETATQLPKRAEEEEEETPPHRPRPRLLSFASSFLLLPLLKAAPLTGAFLARIKNKTYHSASRGIRQPLNCLYTPLAGQPTFDSSHSTGLLLPKTLAQSHSQRSIVPLAER